MPTTVRAARPLAAALAAAILTLPLAGCATHDINASSPPSSPPVVPQGAPTDGTGVPQRHGLTTGQKVLLLAGAAAVYYLYKKHQNAQGQGPNGRYFLSKNGRVYWRDMKTGAFHWVDPPQQPIQVTPEEYQEYVGQRAPAGGGVIQQAPQGWPGQAAYGGYSQ
jgi:hypothetical protein